MTTQNSKLIKKDIFKKLLVFFLAITFHFALFTLHSRSASAAGFGLSVSPSLIEARIEEDSPYQASIQLENKENESVDLIISYHSFKPNQNTTNEIIFDNKNLPIFKNVKVLDDAFEVTTITLGPKQKKMLSLYIDGVKNLKTDSYFSVVFESIPQIIDTNTHVLVSPGVAVNVLVSGKIQTSTGSLEEFSTPWFTQKGPVTFKAKIKNTSNHYIVAQGAVLIKNMFGQTIGKVLLPQTRILENTQRDIPLVWNEKFLLGIYDATLQVSLGENTLSPSRTIRFLAVPFYLVLSIILIAISLPYIWKRVSTDQTAL